MITKIVYIIVDLIAMAALFFTINALVKVRAAYGKWLSRTLVAGAIAIGASVLVALSVSITSAMLSYSLYFASIDWILFFLTGFCLLYTEHETALKKLYIPVACIMMLDSASIFANMVFKHQFLVYEKPYPDTVFYQTEFLPLYYVHLFLTYTLVVLAFFFIIFRIIKSYGLYRVKYSIILSVLLLVVVLNLAYMTLGMVLDASVSCVSARSACIQKSNCSSGVIPA